MNLWSSRMLSGSCLLVLILSALVAFHLHCVTLFKLLRLTRARSTHQQREIPKRYDGQDSSRMQFVMQKKHQKRNRWDQLDLIWLHVRHTYVCLICTQWHTSTIKVTLLASASASKIDSKILGIKIGQALSECSFLSIGCFAPPTKSFQGHIFWSMFFIWCWLLGILQMIK